MFHFHAYGVFSQYLSLLLWSSRDSDEETAHLFSGDRREMKWEKLDFARDEFGKNVMSLIHRESWSCSPALDWAAVEEVAVEERGALSDANFDRYKRDVFYLAGWYARGHRYWNEMGGGVDLASAAVSESPVRRRELVLG